jgi:hypothetical protein
MLQIYIVLNFYSFSSIMKVCTRKVEKEKRMELLKMEEKR